MVKIWEKINNIAHIVVVFPAPLWPRNDVI